MIVSKLKNLLIPPNFDNGDPYHIGRTLYIILLSALGGAFIIAVASYLFGLPRIVCIAGVNVLAILGLLWLSRRRHQRAAGVVTPVLFLGTIIYSMITGDGSHDITVVLFPLAIAIASLLYSRRVFFVFAAFSIISILVIIWGEIYGLFTNRMSNFTHYQDIVIAAGILFCVTVAIRLLSKNLILAVDKSRRNEAALRESRARFQELAELMPETIFEIDLDGNIMFVNHNAYDQFGYTEQDMADGLNALDMLSPQERERAAKAIAATLEGDENDPLEYIACRKDGTQFPIMIRTSRIIRNGRTVGLRGFLIDISERIKHEEDRKKLESQLQQAQKMEAIGTLAGGIAHDFNNILGSILGYTELAILELPDESPTRQHMNEVLRSTTRARDLVRQILAFSRQDKQELKPVKIQTIVKETLKLLRATLPTTIEIKFSDTSVNDTVYSDPTNIHQVLMNLCTNASHAMQQSGGTMHVALSSVDLDQSAYSAPPHLEPGLYLKLSVSDTGNGIPPEDIEKIFDPYFTTKQKGSGTGLGLAVVRGILKSHHGTITVESEPGKGATFHVYLPCIQSVPDRGREHETALPRGREKILVVDDEAALADIAQQMLSRLGYDVVQRTSSIEALELFKADPKRFDLILTDMTMPNMPGDQFAREILMIRPDVPIVICTGYSDRIRKENATRLGIQELVMKPLSLKTLSKTVRKALDTG